MGAENYIVRKTVRLIAVPLLIIAVTVLLIEFDILPWRRAWAIPALIAVYVAIELLISNIKKRG